MARVVAIQRGHDGRFVRQEGEEFDVPDERLNEGSTWFVPVDKKPPPKPKPTPSDRPPGAGPAKGSALGGDKAAPPGAANPPDASGKF